MKNKARQKKKKTFVEERADSFILKSKASVHVQICISKLTHFWPRRLVGYDLAVIWKLAFWINI